MAYPALNPKLNGMGEGMIVLCYRVTLVRSPNEFGRQSLNPRNISVLEIALAKNVSAA